MKTAIYHLANSGMYFYYDGYGLLVDGIYGRGAYQCFSPYSNQMHKHFLAEEGIFGHVNAYIFSHAHGDHCDEDMLYYVSREHTDYAYYIPGKMRQNMQFSYVSGKQKEFELGPFTLKTFETTHERNDDIRDDTLFQLDNMMMVIEVEDEQFLITADALLGEEEVDFVNDQGTMDIAFCNPLQLATKKKLKFFEQIDFNRLEIIHLPEPQDDRYYYRMLAQQHVRKLSFGNVVPGILKQYAWLDDIRPSWAQENQGYTSTVIKR